MNIATTMQKRKITVTCSACGQEWDSPHRCPIPPPIEFSRYSTGALSRLAADLALVLEGRSKEA